MRSTSLLAFASMAAATLAATVTLSVPPSKVARQQVGLQSPSTVPIPDQLLSQGCYSAKGNMTQQKEALASSGGCGKVCTEKGFWTMSLSGGACYCGKTYPPEDSMVDDKKCNYPCPYWKEEACGGIEKPGYYSVFNTGKEVAVDHEPSEKKDDTDDDKTDKDDDDTKEKVTTSSSAAKSSAAPTAPATETTAPADKNADSDSDSGPNVAGIAAGVVVGVVLLAAGIGGSFFWIRRRRNAEIEEEHRRNAAVNAFINGSKPASTNGSVTMTDSRLEPVMAQRRLSDGSIADNQDYSRRILRVTNA